MISMKYTTKYFVAFSYILGFYLNFYQYSALVAVPMKFPDIVGNTYNIQLCMTYDIFTNFYSSSNFRASYVFLR